jgi:hypothetical protein
MRHFLLRLGLASSVGLALAFPAPARECQKRALDALHASAADGSAVFKRVTDKKFFLQWLDCDDPQYELSTAVHESVHNITSETDAFPLVGGGEAERPHEVSSFFPPSRIVGKFAKSDYVDTYLKPGRATSSSDFLYLLDELNAYTHDLNAAVDLKDMRSATRSSDHRDGLAALMAFLVVYVEQAKATDPETWEGLQKPHVASAVEKIWGRAEKVMASSCGIPEFGTQFVGFLQKVCRPEAEAALESVIGRAPVCPTDCLKPLDDQAEALSPNDEDTPEEAPVVEKRTLWKHRNHPRTAATAEASAEIEAPVPFPHARR